MLVEAVKMCLLVHILLIWQCAGDIIRTSCDVPSVSSPGEELTITCFMPDHNINPATGLDVRHNDTVLWFCVQTNKTTYNCKNSKTHVTVQVSMSTNNSISLPLMEASKETEGIHACKINQGDSKHTFDFKECTVTLKDSGRRLIVPANTTVSAVFVPSPTPLAVISAVSGTDSELAWLAFLVIPFAVVAVLLVCCFCRVHKGRHGIRRPFKKESDTITLWQYCWLMVLHRGSNEETKLSNPRIYDNTDQTNNTTRDITEVEEGERTTVGSELNSKNESEILLQPDLTCDDVEEDSFPYPDKVGKEVSHIQRKEKASHLYEGKNITPAFQMKCKSLPSLQTHPTDDLSATEEAPQCSEIEEKRQHVSQKPFPKGIPQPSAETGDGSDTFVAPQLQKQGNLFLAVKQSWLLDQQETNGSGTPVRPKYCHSISNQFQGSCQDIDMKFSTLCKDFKSDIFERGLATSEVDAEEKLKYHEEMKVKMKNIYEDEIQQKNGHEERVPMEVQCEYCSFNTLITVYISANQQIREMFLNIRICRDSCIRKLERLKQEDLKNTIEEMTSVQLTSDELVELETKYKMARIRQQRDAKSQHGEVAQTPLDHCIRALQKMKEYLLEIKVTQVDARNSIQKLLHHEENACFKSSELQEHHFNSGITEESLGNCNRNLEIDLQDKSETTGASKQAPHDDKMHEDVKTDQASCPSPTVDEKTTAALSINLINDSKEVGTAGGDNTALFADINVVHQQRQGTTLEETDPNAAPVVCEESLTQDDWKTTKKDDLLIIQ